MDTISHSEKTFCFKCRTIFVSVTVSYAHLKFLSLLLRKVKRVRNYLYNGNISLINQTTKNDIEKSFSLLLTGDNTYRH